MQKKYIMKLINRNKNKLNNKIIFIYNHNTKVR